MTKIMVVSRSWPAHERSGVSLVAMKHAQFLMDAGYDVVIVGSHKEFSLISSPILRSIHVNAKGSGAIYSPVRINKADLRSAIIEVKPDLVVTESWQTALTDTAVQIAAQLNIPVLMVSHGISIYPFLVSFKEILRSLAWLPYKFFKLPSLIKKLSVITTLDIQSKSNRFADRDLAKIFGVPIVKLRNSPINFYANFIPKSQRKKQILVVGYFSRIKNQIAAISLLRLLSSDINLCFVGDRKGDYFEKCINYAQKNKLLERIRFLQDDECDLGLEIASSLLVFSPSITEALPIVLVESMASGTPFVATSVGAVPSFQGGVIADTISSQVEAIKRFIVDDRFWTQFSDAGIFQYKNEFSESHVRAQLLDAVSLALTPRIKSMQT
jgi:glycosyltransferase involved in cell wall biosynthesis